MRAAAANLTYYNRRLWTPIKSLHSESFDPTCGMVVACGSWCAGGGASLQRLVVFYFFTFFLLCLPDWVVQQGRKYTATETIWLSIYNPDTSQQCKHTSLLSLTEQTLQRNNSKLRLFALSGCHKLPRLRRIIPFRSNKWGAGWCSVHSVNETVQ